jgi:hypothetical protein
MPLAFRDRLAILTLSRPHDRHASHASHDRHGIVGDIPNLHGPMALGTPGETRRSTWIRRLNFARSWAILIIVLCAGLIIGRNTVAEPPTMASRIDTLRSLTPRQHAQLLPSNKRKCAYDFSERCVVCVFKNDFGEFARTSMC